MFRSTFLSICIYIRLDVLNAPKTRRIFLNFFYTCHMLLECLPNTSLIHMDVTFGWSMIIILNMHNKFLEQLNAVPYAPVQPVCSSNTPNAYKIRPVSSLNTQIPIRKTNGMASSQCDRAINIVGLNSSYIEMKSMHILSTMEM